ncbi:MAG: Mediator of RNA polymerase II transcription subunit 18 [Thelocarpon impressellum]|nr:MAG: Mediator of RNA polymerase II transcription subunit 18 [Thelocarpon impressellum]
MHELLLFGQVPSARHGHILKIIAGIAGMQPQRLIERHLIFKPKGKPVSGAAHVGGSQGIQNQQAQALQGQMQGELFYIQLVGEVDQTLFPNGADEGATHSSNEDAVMKDVSTTGEEAGRDAAKDTSGAQASEAYDFDKQAWAIRFSDLPEVAGRRPVTSRMIAGADLTEGDAMEFTDAFGYSYVSEYILEGHRVIHNNVILLLHRVLQFPPSDGGEQGARQKLPPFESLVPLDPSGTYILQASIRVHDGSKPESMTLGINELKGLKDVMRGVVDLEVGDRLALDTRFR